VVISIGLEAKNAIKNGLSGAPEWLASQNFVNISTFFVEMLTNILFHSWIWLNFCGLSGHNINRNNHGQLRFQE
jgi:hypothetical protein